MTTFDQDAKPPMAEPIDMPTPAYATFTRRLQAMFYDSACLICMVAVAVSLVAFGEPFAGAGRVAAGAVVLPVLLYEPLMVALFGGTLGHRRRNMRVVVVKTGRSPGIVRAFVRFILKTILGLPSFVAMAVTTRYQSLHDQITGTVVQIYDLAIADTSDYRRARPVVLSVQRASRLRRALMIIGYSAAIARRWRCSASFCSRSSSAVTASTRSDVVKRTVQFSHGFLCCGWSAACGLPSLVGKAACLARA